MKAHRVAIVPGAVHGQHILHRYFLQSPDTTQGVDNCLLFEMELLIVGQVLQLATPAVLKVWAEGFGSPGHGADNLYQAAFGITFFLFAEVETDYFASGSQWYKDRLPQIVADTFTCMAIALDFSQELIV
jgi:hypothetical protein